MPELDGKATHKDFVTPFDAHEKVVRGPHTHSVKEGYQPAEKAAPVAEEIKERRSK